MFTSIRLYVYLQTYLRHDKNGCHFHGLFAAINPRLAFVDSRANTPTPHQTHPD